MQVSVQSHPVHVAVSGEGPPALFLHGVPDTADLWDRVTQGLHRDYRCYAPDFQGIHRSARNPDFDYSFEGYAAWVEALVEALSVQEPITLVVHDWGGLIGLAWACRHPQRIASIVVLNTVFDPRYRGHLLARLWRLPLVGELVMKALSRPQLMARGMRGSGHPPSSAGSAEHPFPALAQRHSRQVVLKLYRSADMPALEAWVPDFKALAERVPVRVVWGLPDPYIPRWVAHTFFADRVDFVPKAGHWVALTGSEQVVAAMRELRAQHHRKAP